MILATVLIVVLALGGGMMAARLLLKPAPDFSELSATVFQQPRALQSFELLDHHGAAFTNASLAGHWSFLFFGYTHCPDVCPTTLSVLNSVAARLTGTDDPRFGAFATRHLAVVPVDGGEEAGRRILTEDIGFIHRCAKRLESSRGVTSHLADTQGLVESRNVSVRHLNWHADS